MHDIQSQRRQNLPWARILWIAALLVACTSSVALAAAAPTPKLGGAWSGKYGGAYTGTFKLRWTQSRSRLTGSITLSNPRGTYHISGRVTAHGIKFGAVGVGATYTGSVSHKADDMWGHWTSPAGGGSWSALKVATRSKA